MPNKEKSVKIVPKTNGNAGTLNDATRSESTNEVIATDVKKSSNNKKKDKHKNTEAIKAYNHPNAANAIENGLDAASTNNGDGNDADEIRAVSEEILKRLQCNGTFISVCKTDDSVENASTAKKGDNNGLKTVSSDKLQSQQQSKQLNNNNNSRKAHNKNCQNQKKTAASVNISSNNSSDGTQFAQCNGTHAESSEMNTDGSMRLPSSGATELQANEMHIQTASASATATASKEMHTESASCSNQQFQNLPSTSTMNPIEYKHSSLPKTALSVKSIKTPTVEVTFKEYENELQMPDIMRVIQRELSEPYSIYTYRYFIHNWPKLCFLAMDGTNCIGAIVCKLDIHRQLTKRGYIAMLAVDAAYRKLKVGTTLVQKAIEVISIKFNNNIQLKGSFVFLFVVFRQC